MVAPTRIVIIGAGQIGSRHLQSFARWDRPAELYVFDPDERALRAAEERFENACRHASASRSAVRVRFARSVEMLERGSQIDVAIVATGAAVRLEVLRYLLDRLEITSIICEKVLFQDLASYRVAARLFAKQNVQVWVNCPFRTLPYFRTLKAEARSERWEYAAYGSGINLASNAVHHLDLFSFLTGEALKRVRADYLHSRLRESKHAGCIEFTGTLLAESGNHRFEMTSFPHADKPLVIRLMTDRRTLFIEPTAKRVLEASADGTRIETFSFPPQSERTAQLTAEIIDTGTCALPTFTQSRHVHELLLRSFLARLEQITGRRHKRCPIT